MDSGLMNKLFFIKNFFLPAAFFSFVINMLLLAPTFYMLQLFSRVVPTRSEEVLWLITVQLFIALLAMGALESVRSHILVAANNTIDAMLAPFVLHKMIEGAISPEHNPNSYALRDLHTVRTFLTGQGIIQLLDVPWLPIYMLLLYMMNPLLFFLLLAGSLVMVGLTLANECLTKEPLSEANFASGAAARYVDAAIKNAEVVNAMGMQGSLVKRWSWFNDRAMVLQTRASIRAGSISSVTKFLRQMTQCLGMATGAYIMLKDSSFSGGMMMAGGILFGKALGPMEYAITGWRSIRDTRSSYERLEAFLKDAGENQSHLMELPSPTGQLTVDHITFSIRATNKVIVRDVSFSVAAGEFLGIVGSSASGKSTLARLIVNVWRPLLGVIRMDGSDTSCWPSDRLGRHFGYLPQDIELFSGSIAENIARLDEPDSEKVITAAKLAGLHELILYMPNGYDSQIGEGGTVLSGGQRQRIGLARALYGNPKLIVLDEPDASLDSSGEVALINAMVYLKQAGNTVIIITHNPKFLSLVDKLLVMQGGQAIAFGPKEVVLEQANEVKRQQNHVAA
jgi:PrtD family type I secretion system ABC transporter